MGSSESFTEDPFSPPPPSRPAVFVLRNGRYEPQHYMPMPPRTNVIDFDGFVFRRVGGQLVDTKPPEMRQAALVQNPVNLHRDTFAVLQQAHSVEAPCAAGSSRQEALTASFTFVFDATLPGTVSVRVLRPSEASVVLQETAVPPNDSDTHRLNEKTAFKNHVNSEGTLMPLTVDVQTFDAGLDQTYRSASLDLPASSVVDRSDHPDVLVIVKLQANTEDPKRPNVQVTYMSLQPGAHDAGHTEWTAQIRAQEMRCGDQRFDLRDVFGVSARSGLAEVADGNPECIICLSEPRDTAVLPCRHLCFCSYCASIVRLQCEKCPVCRQRVASLLQLRKGADVRQTEPEDLGVETIAAGRCHEMLFVVSWCRVCSATILWISNFCTVAGTKKVRNIPQLAIGLVSRALAYAPSWTDLEETASSLNYRCTRRAVAEIE